MPSPTITVEDLAAELGIKPLHLAARVTALIEELSLPEVIVAAGESVRRTVLTGDAADIIREQLADVAV